MALAISGPGSSDLKIVRADIALARKLGIRWSCHTGAKGVPAKTRDGIAAMAAEGLIDPQGDFVHANTYDDVEIRTILDLGATITAAPEIELQMGHGAPVTDRVHRLGGRAALGIDTEALIGSDMLAVARSALQDARERLHHEYPVRTQYLTGREMLRMITLGNAERMGLADRIGSIEKGKRADLAVFAVPRLQALDAEQLADAFVTQATGRDVRAIWVDGREYLSDDLGSRKVARFDERARELAKLAG